MIRGAQTGAPLLLASTDESVRPSATLVGMTEDTHTEPDSEEAPQQRGCHVQGRGEIGQSQRLVETSPSPSVGQATPIWA